MKFKVDENLPVEAADLLRSSSHDAVTVLEEQLGGKADSDIALLCQQERRALITLDRGFGDVRTYPPKDFAGLIVLRLKQQDKVQVLRLLERLLPVFATQTPAGSLWIVEEKRIRVRQK
ncbi:MAG: DUF5615 family PIN-like protein [Anaerolineae bacterium]